jgi:hypothetical protein
VELYTYFEGHEFVIEKLHKGSVLNFRAFFMEDQMHVNVKISKTTILLELDAESIEKVK